MTNIRDRRMPWFTALAATFVALAMVPAGGAPSAQTSPAPSNPATGRASVRLIRLLSEVPDSVQDRSGPLHDIRVQLLSGNVMVFRREGEFSALLPIDRIEGRVDSLRYFYYVEKPTQFWIFAGERTRGILTVPEGGKLEFDTFRLVWGGGGGGGHGHIYFPEVPENQGLRFSVVSGQSVDRADPKETKYWVELGAGERAGF